MAKYEVGEFEEALAGLRAVVHQCAPEEEACGSTELAAYYAKLAVVLSSASSNPQAAVVVWRKALALDPEVEPAPEHRTPMVARAYREAKQGGEVATESEAAETPVGPTGAEPNTVAERRRIFLLSTGSLKGGLIASDLLSGEIGEGEGAAAFGGLPLQQGAFALGVRARGGGQFPKEGLGGYWGAGFLAGAILGERRTRSFSYVMGGAGVKHFIGADVAHPAVQIIGGRSFGGLLVGGVVDYSYGWIGQRVSGGLGGFSSLPINGHIIQLGIEVGAGQLF